MTSWQPTISLRHLPRDRQRPCQRHVSATNHQVRGRGAIWIRPRIFQRAASSIGPNTSSPIFRAHGQIEMLFNQPGFSSRIPFSFWSQTIFTSQFLWSQAVSSKLTTSQEASPPDPQITTQNRRGMSAEPVQVERRPVARKKHQAERMKSPRHTSPRGRHLSAAAGKCHAVDYGRAPASDNAHSAPKGVCLRLSCIFSQFIFFPSFDMIHVQLRANTGFYQNGRYGQIYWTSNQAWAGQARRCIPEPAV